MGHTGASGGNMNQMVTPAPVSQKIDGPGPMGFGAGALHSPLEGGVYTPAIMAILSHPAIAGTPAVESMKTILTRGLGGIGHPGASTGGTVMQKTLLGQ